MALQQTFSDPITGSVSSYHKISTVTVEYDTKTAKVTVLSYYDEEKREEEKETSKAIAENEARQARKDQLLARLNELLGVPNDENENERKDISAQLQEINDEEDAATYPKMLSRFMYSTVYAIQMNTADDYTLKYAYDWLKTNVYTEAKDV